MREEGFDTRLGAKGHFVLPVRLGDGYANLSIKGWVQLPLLHVRATQETWEDLHLHPEIPWSDRGGVHSLGLYLQSTPRSQEDKCRDGNPHRAREGDRSSRRNYRRKGLEAEDR